MKKEWFKACFEVKEVFGSQLLKRRLRHELVHDDAIFTIRVAKMLFAWSYTLMNGTIRAFVVSSKQQYTINQIKIAKSWTTAWRDLSSFKRRGEPFCCSAFLKTLSILLKPLLHLQSKTTILTSFLLKNKIKKISNSASIKYYSLKFAIKYKKAAIFSAL